MIQKGYTSPTNFIEKRCQIKANKYPEFSIGYI